jgi:hypothetical protein
MIPRQHFLYFFPDPHGQGSFRPGAGGSTFAIRRSRRGCETIQRRRSPSSGSSCSRGRRFTARAYPTSSAFRLTPVPERERGHRQGCLSKAPWTGLIVPESHPTGEVRNLGSRDLLSEIERVPWTAAGGQARASQDRRTCGPLVTSSDAPVVRGIQGTRKSQGAARSRELRIAAPRSVPRVCSPSPRARPTLQKRKPDVEHPKVTATSGSSLTRRRISSRWIRRAASSAHRWTWS